MDIKGIEKYMPCRKRRHVKGYWSVHVETIDGKYQDVIYCGHCCTKGEPSNSMAQITIDMKLQDKRDPKPIDDVWQQCFRQLRFEIRCADAFLSARKLRRSGVTHQGIIEIISQIWDTEIVDLVHDFEYNGYWRYEPKEGKK